MATPSKAVHFRSPAEVLDAYDKQEIPAFALFCAKQLIAKYGGTDAEEGRQQLEFWVGNLSKAQSAAIYTVCFFEEVPEKGIKDNSPYDCSFNFRFIDMPMGYLPEALHRVAGGGGLDLANKLEALTMQVKHLQEQLNEEPEDQDDKPEKKSIGETLLASLEPMLPVIAERVIGALFPPPKPPGAVSRLSGLMGGSMVPPHEQLRINDAIGQLRKRVPDIADILEKLAAIAVKTPNTFDVYMESLRAMKT